MNNAEDICKNFKKVEIQEEEKKIMFNDKEEKELAIMENQIISKDNVRVSIIGNVDSGFLKKNLIIKKIKQLK